MSDSCLIPTTSPIEPGGVDVFGLDFTANLAAELGQTSDALATATVAASPAGVLTLGVPAISGTKVYVQVTASRAATVGSSVILSFTVTTTAGLTKTRSLSIPIRRL